MNRKDFKIVDSFLFSEPYEKELLLLKLQLEVSGIDEWVILENAYTLQGEKKGFHARKVLESDERFLPYLNKKRLQHTYKSSSIYFQRNFNKEYYRRCLL